MDDKFDKMMDALRKKNPTDLQVQKWKNAVKPNHQPQFLQKKSNFYWSQMIAAVFVGIAIGGVLFSDLNLGFDEKNQEIAYENATIEVVYTKL